MVTVDLNHTVPLLVKNRLSKASGRNSLSATKNFKALVLYTDNTSERTIEVKCLC